MYTHAMRRNVFPHTPTHTLTNYSTHIHHIHLYLGRDDAEQLLDERVPRGDIAGQQLCSRRVSMRAYIECV